MSVLRPAEWSALCRRYPAATLLAQASPPVIEVPGVMLGPGWCRAATRVWFVVPVGYPGAQPDCFWADADLRLATGGLPQNSGPQPIPGTTHQGLWFSWHLASWRPATDDVCTYLRFILRRLSDAS